MSTSLASRPTAKETLADYRDVDPYPLYERLRETGPVVWDEGMRAWLVLTHAGCTFVERNEDLFAEPTAGLPGAEQIVGRRDIRSLVGDDHDAVHRPLSHSWRPEPVRPYGPGLVRPLVAARLAGLAEREELELYGDFARLLPISVIAEVLGLPPADLRTLDQARTWMESVLAWRHTYGEDPTLLEAAIEASKALEPALLETVRARRDDPRDDTISLLWAAGRERFPDWGERDVLDNAKFLFEGGSETTAFLVCNVVHHLLALPAEERAAWTTSCPALNPFIEETLRHTTVVHLRARRATTDTEVEGVVIRAGERVIAVNAAANRDPLRWGGDAASFVTNRPRMYGHLAFNVGPRHCSGSHVARVEVTEAVVGLFSAFPDLAPAPGAPAPRSMGFVSRAWRPQVLRHAPRQPAVVRAAVLAPHPDEV
jgi:pulcherriminic acid synthase